MPEASPTRVRSLDALRGFDMFWIAGGDAIARELSKVANNPGLNAVTTQFHEHVEWEGFRFYDLIFPLFLFVIGATIPFALGRRVAEEPRRTVLLKILRRTLILFFLGLVYNGLLHFEGWQHLRVAGVLPRLAIGYGVAATLFVTTKPRVQAIVLVACLLLYWAIMATGPMTQWENVANRLDRTIFFPGQMYDKYGDPEGLLSTIPALGTALLGLLAGTWLRSDRSGEKKALGLLAAGLTSVTLGLIWSPFFPIIKKLWTSSYVLVAGGCSLLLLALFYWIIDVRGWKKWSFPFVVIGSNAILIYMLVEIVDFHRIADYFLGGALGGYPVYKPLGLAIGTITAEWLLLYLLYRKGVFIKV